MSFVFPSIALLGGALALGPILAHLITRRRRRRVAWGAMQFLLGESRRRRAWREWSQWLLLASRVAAVLLVGALLARPLAPDAFASWFGARPTTHLVLLDDSYSMAEQSGDGSAWGRGVDAIRRLRTTSAAASDDARLIVLTYSDAVFGDGAETASDATRLDALAPTETATGPVAGLRRLAELAEQAKAQGRACYAYAVSDFRQVSHAADPAFTPAVEALAAEAEGMLLVPCATAPTANLTLTALTLAPGPRAPGVEMTARVEVRNNGPSIADGVVVALRRNGRPLASLELPSIDPGDRVVESRVLRFTEAGRHVVDAELAADSTPADNRRWLAVDLPDAHPVLVLDGSSDGREGAVVAASLRPGGEVATGWRPRVVRSSAVDDLSPYAVVVALDPGELNRTMAARLSRHAVAGGGVLLALGPGCDPERLNDALAAGAPPLVPWRLGVPSQTPWAEPGKPAVAVSDHPALRVFAGPDNGFLPLVRVGMSHTLAPPSKDAADAGVESLARLADGSPLIVANRCGAGRVMTLLTTAAARGEGDQSWSNLATLPALPILVNELVAWLAQDRLRPESVIVGESAPSEPAGPPSRVERIDAQRRVVASEDAGGPLLASGVYRTVAADSPGNGRWLAANVDPREGDLAGPTPSELRDAFGDAVAIVAAEAAFVDRAGTGGADESALAACVLLALLAAERALAYRCSHVDAIAPRGVARPRAA